jgi:DNA-binding response OmpR family regulator
LESRDKEGDMDGRHKTILVAEDDQNLRLLYREELTDEGYQVILARNGKEATEAVEKNPIDLIILDIVMPVIDGMEALGRIIGHHKNIPMILYTSYPHYKDDFMSWGADAYLIKSSDLTELKATIRRLLENDKRRCSRSDPLKKEVHCDEIQNQTREGQKGGLQLSGPAS